MNGSSNLIEFVLKRNKEQSAAFMDPGARQERQRYRNEHPTEIAVGKCMDGRLNMALWTGTPPGIFTPHRNIGGKFDLGWPFLGRLIWEKAEYAISKGRRMLFIASYHFSKGDSHRGCAGHKYNTDEARDGAFRLRNQFERAFGKGDKRVVYPIVVGMETDEDALVFHGEGGSSFSVADSLDLGRADVEAKLRLLYPTMDLCVLNDLLPLVLGNQRHVAEVRASQRPVIDLQHKEQLICVGRGFDWLHLPNRALIIGPYDHYWENAVVTAGTIALGNLKEGRIPKEHGVLLFVAAPYRDFGAERVLMEMKVAYMADICRQMLAQHVPELQPYLGELVGVVDEHTRELKVLNHS